MQPPSINNAVSALRFFFTVTLDRPDLARRLTVVPYPRRIPAVLSVEEVAAGSIARREGPQRDQIEDSRRGARRQRLRAESGPSSQSPGGSFGLDLHAGR